MIWAGEQCITDCLFFPKPAEIIKSMFAGEVDPAPYTGPKQLAETRDPEVRSTHLASIKQLLKKTQDRLPRMPDAPKGKGTHKPVSHRMTESNWRAKWDMGKIHPDLLVLRENIPARFKKQFVEEDTQTATEASSGSTPPPR